MSDFPKNVSGRGVKLYEYVDRAVLSALHDLSQEAGPEGTDRTSAMYTAIMSAAPAVCFISKLIAKDGGGRMNHDAMDKELPLVAGLILGRVIQLSEDGIRVDFNARNVLAAVEAAEKVAGYDVKPLIEAKMIESYTKGTVKDGKESLGYWDYLPSESPNFNEFADQLNNVINFSKTKH